MFERTERTLNDLTFKERKRLYYYLTGCELGEVTQILRDGKSCMVMREKVEID